MAGLALIGAEKFDHISAFLWAAGGSLALEIIALHDHFKSDNPKALPAKYKNWTFWGVSFLLAAVGGMLAIAENADNPLLAINIGASTPAIMKLLEGKSGGSKHSGEASQ